MAQTDLHIHSSLTAGGELSPRALAERCCEKRLTLAALTDRRAVSGVPECIWRGAQLGVRIVPGIELDCRWREQDFLTLGIGIDITCPALLEIERTRNDPVQSFADWPCSCRRMRWTTPFRWRHSTALRHTAVTPGRTLRGISRWRANTVCSSPAAAASSAKAGRRTGRAPWTFTDRNSGSRRIFLPQQPI